MAQGCAWDLLIFGANLDASGGDVRLRMADGMDLYTALNSNLDVQPKEDGSWSGHGGMSEDGALVNYRLGLAGEEDKVGGTCFQAGQAEVGGLNQLMARENLRITTKDLVQCWITNAAAKLDSIALLIGKGNVPKISSEPFGELPEGSGWREFTTGHTSTADKIVAGDVTFPDFTLKQSVNYAIHGLVIHGATLQWAQIKAKSGPDVGNRPGVIGGDSDIINRPQYFSHTPQFVGKDGLQIGTLTSGGDTSSLGMMCLKEIALNTG